MTTKAITPLRQRMIEDMNARKLCAGTQRGHIRACKRIIPRRGPRSLPPDRSETGPKFKPLVVSAGGCGDASRIGAWSRNLQNYQHFCASGHIRGPKQRLSSDPT